MRISLNWLRQFVDLRGHSVEELASGLTARGLEVEAIERAEGSLDSVFVVEVLECRQHPKAERLHLCEVALGEGLRRRIVCGAPNVREGLFVPCALPGAKLPNGVSVEETSIRGEASAGMLCSEAELGLSEDASGLMLLQSARAGEPLSAYLQRELPQLWEAREDVILEIGLTPNRGDCLSHLGVARELAAVLGLELRTPHYALPEALAAPLEIRIEDTGCERYLGVLLEGVEVLPSPAWLARAVEAAGARSVNNVVDVTNFVLFELGHPQHAFDFDRLQGEQLIVRRAKAGESFEAIDHSHHELCESDLVIADAQRPVALAGVMGGAQTEISEQTRRVLLECAAFEQRSVRLSARRHGLHSESSHRFERGVDAHGLERATARTLELLQRTQTKPIRVLAMRAVGELRPEPAPVILRVERCNSITGLQLSAAQMAELLEGIEIPVQRLDEGRLELRAPTFRFDLEREIDFIEEVVRCYGMDRVPEANPVGALGVEHVLRKAAVPGKPAVEATVLGRARLEAETRVRHLLCDAGLHEAIHLSFCSPKQHAALGFDASDERAQAWRIVNPMAQEQSLMRVSLLPGMLAAVGRNQARGNRSVGLFELASVFVRTAQGLEERLHLGLVLWGESCRHWSSPARSYDVFDLKGIVEELSSWSGTSWSYACAEAGCYPYLHPGVARAIMLGGHQLGAMGEVHPRVLTDFDVQGPVFVAEIDTRQWLGVARPAPLLRALPRFPGASRDVALLLDEERGVADLAALIERERPALLESWEVFDVYRGEGVAEGKKSIALSFVYRDPAASDAEKGRTLTDAEVTAAHDVLLMQLCAGLDAKPR
ncbi:MAG: phenylalanine--tRNA ligase subunit beta [Myxococcota bacterium]|jgi:phenylalanyl-tRNA synthetase beta chain|nr:phenylalanine--tRNA ligase subunit beta [Myxococcota bacterium]